MPRQCVILAAFALALSCLALPVRADGTPLLKPSKDVVVEYRASGMAQGPMAGGDGPMRIYFGGQGSRMRIEPPNGQGYMLMDTAAGRMLVVMTAQRMYMELPRAQSMAPILDATNATFKKLGTDTVAGARCTIYETTSDTRKGQVCLTDDGVMLRGQGGDTGSRQAMEAVKITYAPQPAALFEPPAGFTKMDMPDMGGMLPPAMGGRAGVPPPAGRPPGR